MVTSTLVALVIAASLGAAPQGLSATAATAEGRAGEYNATTEDLDQGRVGDTTSLPWLVGLRYRSSADKTCHGVQIDRFYILTAARCVSGEAPTTAFFPRDPAKSGVSLALQARVLPIEDGIGLALVVLAKGYSFTDPLPVALERSSSDLRAESALQGSMALSPVSLTGGITGAGFDPTTMSVLGSVDPSVSICSLPAGTPVVRATATGDQLYGLLTSATPCAGADVAANTVIAPYLPWITRAVRCSDRHLLHVDRLSRSWPVCNFSYRSE